MLFNLQGQIVAVIREVTDSAFVICSDFYDVLFVLGVFIGQAFKHAIFHGNDFVEPFGLVFKG